MKLLFAHGWGFDRHFWDPLAALLPEWEQARDDRGYFGDPAPVPASAHAPARASERTAVLAVTHSLGTLRVLADPPPGLAGLVAINGFDRFAGDRGVPVRVVDRMLRRFASDPRAVLAEFRRTCGCEAPFGPIDPDPLHADLLRLRDEQAPPPRVPIFVLHGANDPILPAAMRATTLAVGAARRLEHPVTGHLLPVEDPAFCARAVRDLAATVRT